MDVKSHFATIRKLAVHIGRPVRIMEVCGTHTTTAFRSGLHSLLPPGVRLVSGPGCPVCVTPASFIDSAVSLCARPDVSIATFGDLARVPGSASSLETERAKGADVRVVYSASDALSEASRRPERKVIFLGVGFETTAPTTAWTIKKAAQNRVANFMALCAHKTMPPAMSALLSAEDIRIDGFLCPGHVSAIIGTGPYRFISEQRHIPCVISGFEPADMIASIEMLLTQIAEGRAAVENQYIRGVAEDGNANAMAAIREVFEEDDVEWRGLGAIPRSGLRIRTEFRQYDAGELCSGRDTPRTKSPSLCICGDILRGTRVPTDCPLFRTKCTPSTPAGACMVSSEGTCAAYYKYEKTTK